MSGLKSVLKDDLIAYDVGERLAFLRTAQVVETVVCPLKRTAAIAVGEIASEYSF